MTAFLTVATYLAPYWLAAFVVLASVAWAERREAVARGMEKREAGL